MAYGGIVGATIGLAVGACGFVVMRDPIKSSLLAPGEVGYYQRVVLDRWPRIPVHLFGLLIVALWTGDILKPVAHGC